MHESSRDSAKVNSGERRKFMKYFKDKDVEKTIKVLEFAKQAYKKEQDEFHKFCLASLNANCKKDNFYTFFKKVILMDIQSRPNNLSKYEVLRTFDGVENLKEYFTEKNLKKKFEKGEELLEYLEKKLISIKNIGPKIAYVIVRNLVCFGDTEKYFGFRRDELVPLLKLPVDVHVKNLLCYRLKLCPTGLYDGIKFENKKIQIKSENKEFQKELKEEICEKSKKLNPIDLDILWYIGYQNCSKRVYCNNCKIKKYCKDLHFETETRKKLKDEKRRKEELDSVKNHRGYSF